MLLLRTCNIKGICWQCKPAMSCCAETEKTPCNKAHHLPSASPASLLQPKLCTKLPIISPRVPALNVSRITESPSHIKSQTSTVTSHIYLEKLLWHDRVLRGLANQACFLSMCCVKRRQKLRLLTPDFNIRLAFWSLTHQKWLTVKWCNFSSLNQGAFKFLAV